MRLRARVLTLEDSLFLSDLVRGFVVQVCGSTYDDVIATARAWLGLDVSDRAVS
jgi:hypothetical protein